MKQITTIKSTKNWRLVRAVVLSVLVGLCGLTPAAQAGNTLCAEVKIEIAQELTLERQAFEAHRRINHGLTNLTLQNVNILVNFMDE